MQQAQPYSNQAEPAPAARVGRVDRAYLHALTGGVVRLVECALDILVIITASINIFWYGVGGGWVLFVSITALIWSVVMFALHILQVVQKLPPMRVLIEFILCVVYAALYLICGIIAAARAGQLSDVSIGLCSAFSFLAVAAYAIDAYFEGVAWRAGAQHRANMTQQPTAVVVTNTTYAVDGAGGRPATEPSGMYVQGGAPGGQIAFTTTTTQPATYDPNASWGKSAY